MVLLPLIALCSRLPIFHSQSRRALTVHSIPFHYSSTGRDGRHQWRGTAGTDGTHTYNFAEGRGEVLPIFHS